jgi:hypothetical protein
VISLAEILSPGGGGIMGNRKFAPCAVTSGGVKEAVIGILAAVTRQEPVFRARERSPGFSVPRRMAGSGDVPALSMPQNDGEARISEGERRFDPADCHGTGFESYHGFKTNQGIRRWARMVHTERRLAIQ